MNTKQILMDVARKHGIDVELIKGRSRKQFLVNARIEFVVRVKCERSHLSSGVIGRFINRSSWTVAYYASEEFRKRRQSRYLRKKQTMPIRLTPTGTRC